MERCSVPPSPLSPSDDLRPLPPTAVAELQWGEPRLDAFWHRRTCSWVGIIVAGLAAPGGQPLVLAICWRSILTWHHWECQVGDEERGAGREHL
jgi:hypothetical protein